MQQPPPRSPWICLLIVGMLGMLAFFCILGVVIATVEGVKPPEALTNLAFACVGSLSSFLVTLPRGSVGTDAGGASPPRTTDIRL